MGLLANVKAKAQVAFDKLDELKVDLSYIVVTSQTYSEATGAVSQATASLALRGFRVNLAPREIDGTRLVNGDFGIVLLRAEVNAAATAAGVSVLPQIGRDYVKLGGSKVSIVGFQEDPASISLKLYCRRAQ